MAPADDDISIEEKRVYAGSAGRTDVYVATGTGLVRVAVSSDKIGSFGLVADVDAADVAVYEPGERADHTSSEGSAAGANNRAATATVLAVATDDDLLVAPLEGSNEAGAMVPKPDLRPVGVGPTTAVGVHDGAFLVAGTDGTVTRIDPSVYESLPAEEAPASAVETLGTVRDPRAVDGPLVAAADGVHRVVVEGTGASGASGTSGTSGTSGVGGVGGAGGANLAAVGLDDVLDVAGSGVPLAATHEGVYWLGNGWMDALAGDASRVAADGDGHAMAVVDDALYVRDGGSDGSGGRWDGDAWTRSTLPVEEEPVALGYGPGVSAVVTAAGTLCLDAGDGWRHGTVGVRDVRAAALTAARDD